MTNPTSRRVTANLSLSLDGRYNGPGGPTDFGAFAPYVTTDVARDHMTRIWEGATTALLGRVNAQLAVYTGLVETARTNNRAGNPVGSSVSPLDARVTATDASVMACS